MEEETESYKIISPKNQDNIEVGTPIYFECALITDNSLSQENFDKLIWHSSLDGLIGVNNQFEAILSVGEHTISLITLKETTNKNNKKFLFKVIKDEIKVVVIEKTSSPAEIK